MCFSAGGKRKPGGEEQCVGLRPTEKSERTCEAGEKKGEPKMDWTDDDLTDDIFDRINEYFNEWIEYEDDRYDDYDD